MQFVDLQLQNFRCFAQLQLEFDQGFNLFHGDNASGKSSLMEALFWLTHKRSFRSSRQSQLILHGQDSALVISKVRSQEEAPRVLAARLSKDGAEFRYQGQDPQRSFLHRRFPCVLIEPERSMNFLRETEQRRRWLDRLVFHVERPFLATWQHYQRALSQRNAAIRKSGQNPQLWNEALNKAAIQVTRYRQHHWEKIYPKIQELLAQLSDDRIPTLSLEFRPGWDTKIGLLDQLVLSEESERKMGYTLVGPHRADIVVRDERGLAKDWLSRGQTKLLALCFQLALIMRLSEAKLAPALLWDDWSSELSEASMDAALSIIRGCAPQSILSSPSSDWPQMCSPPEFMFHVKH